MAFLWVLVALVVVRSSSCEILFSTKFHLHPGAIVKLIDEYHFYDHVDWIPFDIPQLKKTYTLSMPTVPVYHPYHKLFKAQGDLSSTLNSFQQSFRTEGYHHIDSTLSNPKDASYILSDNWSRNSSEAEHATSFNGPAHNNFIISDSVITIAANQIERTGTDVLNRPARAIPVILGAMLGKMAAKAAISYAIPAALGMFSTKTIRENPQLFQSEEYRKLHDELHKIPGIVQQEYDLLDQLVVMKSQAEELMKELDLKSSSHYAASKHYLGEFLKIIINMQVEIAENAESIAVFHSNGLCQAGLLPPTAVPVDFLKKFYTEYSTAIRNDRELLISVDDLGEFYKKPFSLCKIDEYGGMIHIPAMQIAKKHRYNLYELTPIGFRYAHKGECKIKLAHTNYLYDDHSGAVLPAGQGKHFHCLAGTRYCKTPTVYEINSKDITCAAGIISLDWEKIRQCEIQCDKDIQSSLQISHQANTMYLSGIESVDIELDNGSTASYSAEPYYGAMEIEMPCQTSITVPSLNFEYVGNLDACAGKNLDVNIIASPAFFPHIPIAKLHVIRSKKEFEGLIMGRYIQPNYAGKFYNQFMDADIFTATTAVFCIAGAIFQIGSPAIRLCRKWFTRKREEIEPLDDVEIVRNEIPRAENIYAVPEELEAVAPNDPGLNVRY